MVLTIGFTFHIYDFNDYQNTNSRYLKSFTTHGGNGSTEKKKCHHLSEEETLEQITTRRLVEHTNKKQRINEMQISIFILLIMLIV